MDLMIFFIGPIIASSLRSPPLLPSNLTLLSDGMTYVLKKGQGATIQSGSLYDRWNNRIV